MRALEPVAYPIRAFITALRNAQTGITLTKASNEPCAVRRQVGCIEEAAVELGEKMTQELFMRRVVISPPESNRVAGEFRGQQVHAFWPEGHYR